MSALEYMEKQLKKHRSNFDREFFRGASEDVLRNICLKIGYYETAVAALKLCKRLNSGENMDGDSNV